MNEQKPNNTGAGKRGQASLEDAGRKMTEPHQAKAVGIGTGQKRRGSATQIIVVGKRDTAAIAAVMREWLAPALAELFLAQRGYPRPGSRAAQGNIRSFSSSLGINPTENKR